jgi:3-oxo-5-alpha-steroid 4-dehydrogenase 1
VSAASIFTIVTAVWTGAAVATFVALFFLNAPYGRHARTGWGPVVGDTLGWVLMEAPSPLIFAAFFALGTHGFAAVPVLFFVLFEAHYVHRSFIYPFMLRGRAQRMTLAVALMGFFFNGVNATLNGWYLFHLAEPRPLAWLLDGRFVVGFALFVGGFVINRWSDAILRGLRRPGESDYRIPHGGVFRWVSSPNYLGEIMEWVGWAVLTWSFAGASFAAWTIANLAPRARANQLWYRQRFPDYPTERKALIPLVW